MSEARVCKRCKKAFEPRNPADYVTICEDCDYEYAEAMETAEQVLKGVLGRKDMTFAQFREAMIEQHPRFLSDNDLHILWQDNADLWPTKTEAIKAVDQAMSWVEQQERSRYFKRALSKASKPEEVFGPMRVPAAPTMRERLTNLLSRIRA